MKYRVVLVVEIDEELIEIAIRRKRIPPLAEWTAQNFRTAMESGLLSVGTEEEALPDPEITVWKEGP